MAVFPRLAVAAAFEYMEAMMERAIRAKSHRLLAWVLVAIAAAAYVPSLRVPFLFDDAVAITSNPTIRSLGLGALNPPADGRTTSGRPVVNFTFAVNYAISGERTWSYHALNIAIHAAAAFVLFALVRLTLRRAVLLPTDEASAWTAFIAALLWAVHPLQTESVISPAQRTETLCALLYLLTLYAFARGTDSRPKARRWLAISVVSCLAGMGAKEAMVTAPVLVLLYDRTFVAGSFATALRLRAGYYAALASTWLLLGWLVLRSGGSRGIAAGFGLGVNGWNYLLQQCEALVLYLKLTVWPHPLVLDYGTEVPASLADVAWQAGVVLALLAMTAWALVHRPRLGFWGAWFFVILAPSSSVVPLVTQTMSEHRMYLPLAALVVPAAVFLVRCAVPARGLLLAGGLVVVLTIMTIVRIRDYRDAVTIWTDTTAKRPQNARAHNNLGWAWLEHGDAARAGVHFARALALQPDYASAQYNAGVALLQLGRAAEAATHFETAVRLSPTYVDAHANLGNALVQAGRARDAMPHFEAALRFGASPDLHYNTGIALVAAGQPGAAAQHFQEALTLSPQLPEAHYQLGRLAENAGDTAAAQTHFNATLALDPAHGGAHGRLGLLLAKAGRLEEAERHFRARLRSEPQDADAHANLGNVLLLQGRARDAIASYEAALALRPDDARARQSLQIARETLGLSAP